MANSTTIPVPVAPVVDIRTGYASREWYFYWSQPHFPSLSFEGQISVANGGTGLSSGNPGGIPYFKAQQGMASSEVLGEGMIVFGGGGAGEPSTPLGTGKNNSLLVANPNGFPAWFNLQDTAQIKWKFDGQSQSITASVSADANISGTDSVQVQSINGGNVISLIDDVAAPGNLYFYGTGSTGNKGWFAASTAYIGVAGNVTLTTDATGVTTINLATVTDVGGGTLQKTAFDAYGRMSGTSAATTSDLTEGTNLYFTNARVLAATLTGLSVATATDVVATDAVLVGIGKLQGQITANVSAIAEKEPSITAGTITQYWRGDKSWQTLDSASVGLANVDNTSDVNKPVSTAQQTAIDYAVTHIAPVTDTVTAETFLNAVGGETSAPLTFDGSPLDGAFTLTAMHRTDWQGRQLLYPVARTNWLKQSDNLSTTQWLGTPSKTLTTTLYAGELPYYEVKKTTTSGSESTSNSTGKSASPGDVIQLRIAMRAGTKTTGSVGILGNADTWGPSPNASAVIVSGPGAIAQNAGALFSITGLSAAADTVVLITRTIAVAEVVLSAYLYPGTPNSYTVGDSNLFTAAMVTINGGAMGAHISTTTAPVTVTDYTLSGSTASFGQAATAGAVYDWDGTYTPENSPSFNGPVRVGSYTLATLPSAAAFNGYLITVSDATAGPALCLSNGTNWININTNAAVT